MCVCGVGGAGGAGVCGEGVVLFLWSTSDHFLYNHVYQDDVSWLKLCEGEGRCVYERTCECGGKVDVCVCAVCEGEGVCVCVVGDERGWSAA